jgi:hypothetical protein
MINKMDTRLLGDTALPPLLLLTLLLVTLLLL